MAAATPEPLLTKKSWFRRKNPYPHSNHTALIASSGVAVTDDGHTSEEKGGAAMEPHGNLILDALSIVAIVAGTAAVVLVIVYAMVLVRRRRERRRNANDDEN